MLNIKIKTDKLKPELEKILDSAMNDIADLIADKADETLNDSDPKVGAFDRGFLAASQVVDRDEKLNKEVGYEAPYACIVGSKSKIKCYNGQKSIGRINLNDKVLSKDGNYHKIINKIDVFTVHLKPNLILLKCEKNRSKNGLLLTNDHLVLTYKNNYVYWEQCKNLVIGDIVFKPKKICWNKGNITKVERICKYCNKIFTIPPSQLNHSVCNYCSMNCYHKHTRHDRTKGKTWKLTKEQKLNKSGKNNPTWKGGISKLPYGIEWNNLLKEQIKDRDNYTCQICNKQEYNELYSFHVHHIDGNKFNNNINNLITLCSSCHGKQQWKDAELVSINLDIFEPVKLIKVKKIKAEKYFTKKDELKKVRLYDIHVENENSFVATGILIHNSYIEYGTDPHYPPLEPIYDWVWRKRNDLKIKYNENNKTIGFDGREYITEILRVAQNIIWKIGRKGTEPKPFLRPALQYGRKETKRIIEGKFK